MARGSFIAGSAGGGVKAGTVGTFAANAPPSGWLECNGAAVSRTAYAALFTAIGTTHGAGDGSTTFNLPDLRGEFIRGWDNGRGADSGRGFGSYQGHAIQSHSHSVSIPKRGPNSGSAVVLTQQEQNGTKTIGTSASGGSETRPRNRALLFMIKY